jgi:DNA-binding FadR family transcriptional regulator
MSFESIPAKTSAADDCRSAIERVIVRGELKPGDRLPPERTLATMLDRNRLTVRNALGRLADAGLLSVRQGSGYVVRDLRRHAGPALLPRVLECAAEQGESEQAVIAILSIRRSLTRALLERLSERGSGISVEGFEEALRVLSHGVETGESDPIRIMELDEAVISSLLDAADSTVLDLFVSPLRAAIRSAPAVRDIVYKSAEDLVAGYRLFAYWLPARNPREIDALMERLAEQDRRIPRDGGKSVNSRALAS